MAEGQPWGTSSPLQSGESGSATESVASCRATLVQHAALFLNISKTDCREIVSSARKQEYSRRETIHFEGDPVRQVVLLTSGCAKIVQFGPNGTEVILRLNGPGEVVGTLAFCSQERHVSMAQALSASTALVWDVTAFDSISKKFPVLRRNAMHILCNRLKELEERFREISTEKVAARLSHEIVRLLHQVGRRVNGAVEISLSREELAQLIGTTLFTVSRLLSDWDERGIVSARREAVSVHNLEALVALSESE